MRKNAADRQAERLAILRGTAAYTEKTPANAAARYEQARHALSRVNATRFYDQHATGRSLKVFYLPASLRPGPEADVQRKANRTCHRALVVLADSWEDCGGRGGTRYRFEFSK